MGFQLGNGCSRKAQSSKMNYTAQLEFAQLDDVYVTSHDVIFAFVQLFGISVAPPRLLGL